MSSIINLYSAGTDFIPVNPHEWLGDYSLEQTHLGCSFLCHQDPQCRTFVIDPPICRLYEGSRNSGQIVSAMSASSKVGEIIYDNINLTSAYNQTCDHCYPDRYLVCKNDRCQCPPNTFWNDKDQCMNQQFVDSSLSCEKDSWCRQDINITCYCKKCQCPLGNFWENKMCIPQFLEGASCNISNQCRNDLQLVCSRINKTCIGLSSQRINVIDAIIPVKFAYLRETLVASGEEWWTAFDGNMYSGWNSYMGGEPNLMFVTFDDEYLLTSMQLTVYGDQVHDPKIIELYLDENATCLVANFSFPLAPETFYTYTASSLSNLSMPIVTKYLLINIPERQTNWQTYLCELPFYGIPY